MSSLAYTLKSTQIQLPRVFVPLTKAFWEILEPKEAQNVKKDLKEANRLNLQGTPTYFINGNILRTWPTEPIIKVFLKTD